MDVIWKRLWMAPYPIFSFFNKINLNNTSLCRKKSLCSLHILIIQQVNSIFQTCQNVLKNVYMLIKANILNTNSWDCLLMLGFSIKGWTSPPVCLVSKKNVTTPGCAGYIQWNPTLLQIWYTVGILYLKCYIWLSQVYWSECRWSGG